MSNNKIYSDKQEKVIAKKLKWKQVSGSGARPFHVGDVVSDDWLGECKTHTKPDNKIEFKVKVWEKLLDEALSTNKYPIYFCDDGSQNLRKIWCCISEKRNPFGIFLEDKLLNIVTKDKNIRFEHDSVDDILISNGQQFIKTTLGDEDVYIMPLQSFYNLIYGE